MMKERKKKIQANDRIMKYALARAKGDTKKEAQIKAGFRTPTQAYRIEKTKTYQIIQSAFKDEFLAKMTLTEMATHLIDNIRQEGQERPDRNARNAAIKIALDKIEPENKPMEEHEKVVIGVVKLK